MRLAAGKVCLFDKVDWDLASAHPWSASGRYVYAPKRKLLFHRAILSAPAEFVVDHVNSDGLDNRRANIRLATPQENMRNRRKLSEASSRFKGVWWCSDSKIWRAEISTGGADGKIRLGRFTDECAAARQYDRAARVFFGKFALTNEAAGLL